MKFQKLTIHNIASIEDAVIDFESAPLADSEVFLITGKTGAGKSTILDAICLALYSNTPRLDGTRMQGDTKDGERVVKIDDPRQLMRRNTAEAFVSLTFTGNNGVHYEAVWSVARARRKVTGNLQSKVWQLTNLDTVYMFTKDKEIEAGIKAATGLDFNQFCRTTMLAQGEFTRFLNSRDEDKAEILEKITGVDIYSKIGAKVYEVTVQKEAVWKDAQRLVDGVRSLTEEEIERRVADLSGLDCQYNKVAESRQVAVFKRDWIGEEAKLNKGVVDARVALEGARSALESDGFKVGEALVREWNETADARMWLSEARKAEAAGKRLQNAIAKLSTEFGALLGSRKYAESEIEKLKAELVKIDGYLSAHSDKAAVYENAQTIAGYLSTVCAGRESIEKGLKDIADGNRLLTEGLSPAFEAQKKAADEARMAFEKDDAELRNREEVLCRMNLPGLRARWDEAKDLIGRIRTAKACMESLELARLQNKAAESKLAYHMAAIKEMQGQSKAMEAPVHDAEVRMGTAKECFESQKDTIDKFASALRARLVIGDVCPVCRQRISNDLPHEEELATLVKGLQAAYKSAEGEYRKLYDAKIRLDAEIKTELSAFKKASKALDEDRTVEIAERRAREAYEACGVEVTDESARAVLDCQELETAEDLRSLDSEIRSGEAHEKELASQRKALNVRRSALEKLAEKLVQAEKAVSECKGRIATSEALVAARHSDVRAAEQCLSGTILTALWPIDWRANPGEFSVLLDSSAKEYKRNVQRKQTLESRIETAGTKLGNVACVIGSILANIPSWNLLEAGPVVKVDNLLEMANGISEKVTVALTQMKAAEERFNSNNSLVSSFLASDERFTLERLTFLSGFSVGDISRKDCELQKYREEVVAKNTLLGNALSLYEAHQSKKPGLTEEDSPESLDAVIVSYGEELQGITEKKVLIGEELRADRENKERLCVLVEDAGKKRAEYEKWSRMNQLIGDSTGNKFRKIAQSYVLSSLIHSANSYMKTLTDRYTLKVNPGTFVISIEDAYQGFASRAASTISGGESFLVSLSLALALSDIGQTLSVDTLFIDEGFGTLSGEPLQNAINTLRTLHTKAGRHVGIISHVEELQERIPVQIQVNQEGNNSSSTVRIVPE